MLVTVKVSNDCVLATRNETALKAATVAASEQPTVVTAANLSSQISGGAELK